MGPVNVPILAKSVEHVRSIFGNSGTLFDAYAMIDDSDIQCNVHLIKTAGRHSELYLNVLKDNGEIIENGFYIKSKHANEISNDIEIYLDDNVLTFKYPVKLGGNTLSYSLSNYNTLHELANAINSDTRLLKGEVWCSAFCEPHISCKFSLAPVNATDLKLTGGDNGIYYNKNMMYNCMTTTYSILEGAPTDIIVPLDSYYDDTLTDDKELLENYNFEKDYVTLKSNGQYLSFYKQLLDFCKLQMQSSIITHGVMGMNPLAIPDIDEAFMFKRLDTFNKANELSMEDRNYSHMISVTASEVYGLYGTLVVNSYIAYAVLVASTKISETSTNKRLPSSFILFNIHEQYVLKQISEMGYVCFRNSPLTRNIHVVNGVTKSGHKDLKFLCNVRMIQVVMKNLRISLSKFIGQNVDDLIKSGEINKEMTRLMNDLNENNFVKDFSALNVMKKDEGHLLVDLTFATKYMVENIKSFSGLCATGDIINGLQGQ